MVSASFMKLIFFLAPKQNTRKYYANTFGGFLNPVHVTDLLLYLLKTSETLWFSEVFRGYRKRVLTNMRNEL